MTAGSTASDERQALSEFAEQNGWRRDEHEHVDLYIRGLYQVQVVWQGDSAISGASHHEDSIMLAYTREPNKIRAWLAK